MTSVSLDMRMRRHAGIGTYLDNLVPALLAQRPSLDLTLLGDPEPGSTWQAGARIDHRPLHAPIYSIFEQIAIG